MCKYIYIHADVCVYTAIGAYMYMHVYIHMYMHMYTYIYVHIYVHIYIHIYIHMYVCMYMHIYLPLSGWWRNAFCHLSLFLIFNGLV